MSKFSFLESEISYFEGSWPITYPPEDWFNSLQWVKLAVLTCPSGGDVVQLVSVKF
jgi:hypothetical protein